MTLPEFRERLLALVPCLFAVDGAEFIDAVPAENWHRIAHDHMTQGKYWDLVAGFDRADLVGRLQRRRDDAGASRAGIELDLAHARLAQAHAQLAEANAELGRTRDALDGVVRSRSWRVTAPLRSLRRGR